MWSLTRLKRFGVRTMAIRGSIHRCDTRDRHAPACRLVAFMVALTGLHVSVTVNAQQPIKTEVFTLSTIAMTNTPGATIYYVDGISQIQNFLSAGLPKDPAAAQAIAKERWGTLGRQGNQRLQNAGVGLGRAVQLRVNRAPAIVFDDRAIVYGVTDVAYAAQIYRSRLASGAARK